MDLVPPVTAGIFPLQQRSLRRRNAEPDDSVGHEVDSEDSDVSLRPSPTIANIGMLLEILSDAGTPANISQPIHAVTAQGASPKRRMEDYQNAHADRTQGRFDFTE